MAEALEEPVFTIDDLLALPDDGARHELLWGALVMTPAPSAHHADLVDGLAVAMRAACPPDLRVRANSGIVVPARPVVNAPAADLYVCRRDAPAAGRYVEARDVLLAVEVSLSTRRRDAGLKADAYAAGGVPWYWLVTKDHRLEVHRLGTDGRYQRVLVAEPGTVTVLPGPFELALDPGTLADG